MKISCCTLLCCALLIPSCSLDLEVWKDNESEDDLSTIQWRSNDDNIFAKRSPITQNFLQFAEEKGSQGPKLVSHNNFFTTDTR